MLDVSSTFADFSWGFALNAIMEAGATGAVGGYYFSTASIDNIALIDDVTGENVSDEFGLGFESRATYRVPEPSTGLLLLAGLGAKLLLARRRAH